MFDLNQIQKALKEFGMDGWLLHDFRGSNALARTVLDFNESMLTSRRWFYMVPAQGQPTKLVHRIEGKVLDHLPGEKQVYLQWQMLEQNLQALVEGKTIVSMEYTPLKALPYVSKIDAGTVELVVAAGAEVVCSGDLIQLFEATLDEDQWSSHLEVDKHTMAAFDLAFGMIAEHARKGKPVTETQVQATIQKFLEGHDLKTDHPAIVGVGPHSGDPHFEPTPKDDTPISEGSFVLIDLWARQNRPKAVYSDITKVGYVGDTVPQEYEDIMVIVARARDAAVTLIKTAFADKRPLRGFEVDDAARRVIEEAGYGRYFVHRTGHSIGHELHGNGTHMDNLETHDDRLVLPNTLFSVEPGIYQEKFGIRSEVNVFVDGDSQVHVTGQPQDKVLPILA